MEQLHFDDINQYLLLKNGNYLYKVPYREGFAVLKLYYGSRGWPERILKTLDYLLVSGQTSFMPKARLRTEQDAMRVWREAGFRVFDIYDDIKVDGLPDGGYALYEYVEGRHFHKLLPDESVPLEERLSVYRIFLEQWQRRHRLAVECSEPRLIHENGDLKHVIDRQGELIWFDFEICFRSRTHVEDLVAREIVNYLKSLADFMPTRECFELFFSETMNGYTDKEMLANVYPVFLANRRPPVRLGRRIEYRFGKRAKRPNSKYRMALRVREHLTGRSTPAPE